MGLCNHGINTMNRRCDRCQEIAEAENNAVRRHSRGPVGRPKLPDGSFAADISVIVTDNQMKHIEAHLRMIKIPFTVKRS